MLKTDINAMSGGNLFLILIKSSNFAHIVGSENSGCTQRRTFLADFRKMW